MDKWGSRTSQRNTEAGETGGQAPFYWELAEGPGARHLMGPCPSTTRKLPFHLPMLTVGGNDGDDAFAGRSSGKLAISKNESSQHNKIMGLF